MKPIIGAAYAVAAIVLTATSVLAQEGSISGVVYDAATGEKLSGASVFLIGTTFGATTDLDGKYSISNVPAGAYDVRVTCDGYSTKVLPGVNIVAGLPLQFDVRLEVGRAEGEPGTYTTHKLEDMVITAEQVLSTDAAVLSQRMKSATIGDGISKQQIARSPDATSGDALKRVTGLSVVDDKYVFVRGVTDRYNAATLNGVQVSSTDTDEDKKSFAFDLVPASLMSNSIVVKTATPDLQGDFTGGLVQVNTLEFPAERVINLVVGMSYNTNTTNKEMKVGQGGSTDWLGKDDGTRARPEGLVGYALAVALPNNWGTKTETARPNGKFGLSYGDHHRFLTQQEIGYIGSLTYNADSEIRDFVQSPTRYGSTTPYEEFYGTRYRWGVRVGGLLNVNYKPRPRHKFGFKNTYNRVAKETVSQSQGSDETGGNDVLRQDIQWDERMVYVGQLVGDHSIPVADGLDVDWRLEYTTSNAHEPDRKRIEYEFLALSQAWGMQNNYRSWNNLQEDIRGGGVDVTQRFRLWSDFKVKAGYYRQKRERAYDVDSWYTDLPTERYIAYELPLLPVDSIFAPERYGTTTSIYFPGREVFGWRFTPQTVYTGKYSADSEINSYYLMADFPFFAFGEALRFAGGARIEDFEQHVLTQNEGAPSMPSEIDTVDVLPSANLTYMFSERTNVRLAYYKSVNRPEFREMSNVLYYNFGQGYLVQGNPELKRAVIDNYDARFEWFPSPGEVLAASVFYKEILDAIEVALVEDPERPKRTWFNAPKGKNYGFELEIRKNLGFLGPRGRHFAVMANYTRVESEVEYTTTQNVETPGGGQKEVEVLVQRPLQGQAPYMINLGLYVTSPRWATTASLLYNRIGRRLDIVADETEMDVYEEPRNQVDLALTQGIGRVKTKFTIKNLLGEDEVYTSGAAQNVNRVWRGITKYSLSLSFDF